MFSRVVERCFGSCSLERSLSNTTIVRVVAALGGLLKGSIRSPTIFGQHPWNTMEPSYVGVQRKFLKTTEIPFMARIFPNSADLFFGDGIPRGNHPQKFLPQDFRYRTCLTLVLTVKDRLFWLVETPKERSNKL